jgi:GAF domain-containing protein
LAPSIWSLRARSAEFSPGQIEIAQTIASQAAIAAQNANLLEQSFLRTRELETLFEASQATALTLDLNEVIQSVAQQMLHALAVDACTIMLWDEVEQMLVVYADLSMTGDTRIPCRWAP